MDIFFLAIDFLFHLDKYLGELINAHSDIIYFILFLIVLCETGFVVFPFLPGDSLLFATGTFCAIGALDLLWIITLLSVAAIVGDTINYWIGYYLRDKFFNHHNIRLVKREYLEKTYIFYKKYGGKVIILARFIPIIRTFAPFIAGVGHMKYVIFIIYNIIGGLTWVGILTLGGYFFADLFIIKNNFFLVMIFIVFISILPMIIDIIRIFFLKK